MPRFAEWPMAQMANSSQICRREKTDPIGVGHGHKTRRAVARLVRTWCSLNRYFGIHLAKSATWPHPAS